MFCFCAFICIAVYVCVDLSFKFYLLMGNGALLFILPTMKSSQKKKKESDFSGIWSITALSWCYFGDITQRQILQLGFRASSFQSVSFQDFFPFTVLSSLIGHCSIYTTCSLHFFGVRFVRLPSSIVQQYLVFFPSVYFDSLNHAFSSKSHVLFNCRPF